MIWLVIWLGSTCHCPQIVPMKSMVMCEQAAVALSATEQENHTIRPYIAPHTYVSTP